MAVFQKILTKDKIRDKKTGRLIKSSQERYKDVETGKIVSRRQRDKIQKATPVRIREGHKSQNTALARSYIEKQARKGKLLTLRQANLSASYTNLIKDLRRGAKMRIEARKERDAAKLAHADDIIRKALEKTTRRDNVPLEVVPGESF